jgi:hypothetical protein
MVADSRHSPSYGADMDRLVREHAIFAVIVLVLPVWTELLAVAKLVAQSVVSASLSERRAALPRDSVAMSSFAARSWRFSLKASFFPSSTASFEMMVRGRSVVVCEARPCCGFIRTRRSPTDRPLGRRFPSEAHVPVRVALL